MARNALRYARQDGTSLWASILADPSKVQSSEASHHRRLSYGSRNGFGLGSLAIDAADRAQLPAAPFRLPRRYVLLPPKEDLCLVEAKARPGRGPKPDEVVALS